MVRQEMNNGINGCKIEIKEPNMAIKKLRISINGQCNQINETNIGPEE
jgi:hypothetical protein